MPTGDALREHWLARLPEGERKILMDLSGIGSKSIEERAVIIKNAYKALNSAADRRAASLEPAAEPVEPSMIFAYSVENVEMAL